eukprot:10996042-Karenia_brevis.AAC.1
MALKGLGSAQVGKCPWMGRLGSAKDGQVGKRPGGACFQKCFRKERERFPKRITWPPGTA